MFNSLLIDGVCYICKRVYTMILTNFMSCYINSLPASDAIDRQRTWSPLGQKMIIITSTSYKVL